jgi:hypothetical protein
LDEDVAPTDLRPSLATAPYHIKVTYVSIYDKGPAGISYGVLSRILQMDLAEITFHALR